MSSFPFRDPSPTKKKPEKKYMNNQVLKSQTGLKYCHSPCATDNEGKMNTHVKLSKHNPIIIKTNRKILGHLAIKNHFCFHFVFYFF